MKRVLIIIVLFGLLGFISARIHKVPEDVPHNKGIQWAIDNLARPGDTISVWGYGEPPFIYQEHISFLGKNIVVSNRGYVEPGYPRDSTDVIITAEGASDPPVMDNRNRRFLTWTRPLIVNRPDTTSDIQPHIAVDNSSYPWVVWMSGDVINGSNLSYTKWNGTNWIEESVIVSYPCRTAVPFRPCITFDDQNQAWIVYDKNFLLSDSDVIYFTFWDGNRWHPEAPVHQVDSIRYNFIPKIAFGGGQVWCCWFGNVTDRRYKIYVSRWNGNNWEPKTQISPPDTSHRWHWWCDIAVDSLGLPHVVWSATGLWEQFLFYRTYNGTRWLEPETLNNPQIVRPGDWTGTAISIDKEGIIHVVWAGYAASGNSQDIFYSRKENRRWLEPVCINRPDGVDDFYPDIIAKSPNDIWAGWNKDLTWGEIYVSHFDGYSWSAEQRLDNESIAYDNGSTQLVFRGNEVWAAWEGYTVGIGYPDIYYSRYLDLSVNERQSTGLPISHLLMSPNPFQNNVLLSYRKDSKGHTFLAIYNLNGNLIRVLTNHCQEAGYHKIAWDGKDENGKEMPKGVYFVVLKTVESKTVKKIIKNGG